MLGLKIKSPLSDLSSALEENMKPSAAIISSGPPALGMGMGQAPTADTDRDMIINRLRSINRMSQILEQMACGCEPMPSWAEAKIYSSAKDLQGVLGYLLGDKPL